ncbi:putative bifunctional diguanylate cyclase/phosphodiesterase [Catellatospora coxensis]|uniref:GGDEF domain-containing protein n=1 Tax=Catellatospora coxensis TaxID=310354 RepID=A0A8J3P971_9ACTN|nr:bifunctional diguanylate cyclase/phosphodiesterase [Catellatospora coxensis]GIG08941.1 GGDEF domain-containing protein [Catellatospora coxensis]
MSLPKIAIDRTVGHAAEYASAAGDGDGFVAPGSFGRHTPAQPSRQHTMYDQLTGLPNRIMLKHALCAATSATAAQRPVGLCHLDLDGFTAINQTHGYDAGDRLLQTIAQRLSAVLCEGCLVARTGSDQFTVLVSASAHVTDITRVAEAIQQAVRRPLELGGQQVSVTACIGMATPPPAGSAVGDLLSAAESALLLARAAGHDQRRLFDPDEHAHRLARHEIARQLPLALQRGELFLEYQPIVEAGTGDLYGVEALVRWRHPRRGVLGPAEFVPVAEQTGLINEVGRFVLRTACAQAQQWQARNPGHRLVMSVNVAPSQADDPQFAGDVADLLSHCGIDPELLQLEITESSMLSTSGQVTETIRTLAGLGVRVAIDDFGTGYANLANLRSLPVHTLKLARQFVTPFAGDTGRVDAAMVDTIVRLAHGLGLGVIAEGVETPEQADTVRRLGCDLIQGFRYGRPQAPQAVDARLRAAATPVVS